jgi:hypothetical protein
MDQEHHEEGHDRGAGVDDELPVSLKPKTGPEIAQAATTSTASMKVAGAPPGRRSLGGAREEAVVHALQTRRHPAVPLVRYSMAMKILLTHPPEALRNYYGERALAGLREVGDVRLNPRERELDARELIEAAAAASWWFPTAARRVRAALRCLARPRRLLALRDRYPQRRRGSAQAATASS